MHQHYMHCTQALTHMRHTRGRLHAVAHGQPQEELRKLRCKEAALQIQLAEKNLENLELIKDLNAVQQAADPSVVQLKQLMLDPAVNREFQRLKADLEDTQRELKHAQENLQAVNFTQVGPG